MIATNIFKQRATTVVRCVVQGRDKKGGCCPNPTPGYERHTKELPRFVRDPGLMLDRQGLDLTVDNNKETKVRKLKRNFEIWALIGRSGAQK